MCSERERENKRSFMYRVTARDVMDMMSPIETVKFTSAWQDR